MFFDVGGTLAHPSPSFNGLFAQVCRAQGLAVTEEEAIQAEPRVWAKIAERLDGGRGFSLSTEDSHSFWLWVYRVFLEEVGHSNHHEVPERLYATFTRPESYQLYDDALPALQRLHAAGLCLGVISNWESWADALLDSLGIRSYFQCALISGVFGVEKPDPAIFHRALQTAGATPSEALHVGDNPLDDVQGAMQVGMHAVLLERTRPSMDERKLFQQANGGGQAPALPGTPPVDGNNLVPPPIRRAAPMIPPFAAHRGGVEPALKIGSLLELPALLGLD